MGNGYGFTAMWGYGLLVTIGLVVLVVLAVRVLSGGIGGGSADQTGARTGVADPGRGRARDILDERYARGELSTQEYEEQLRILAGGS
jgi:putative membrane protein